LKLTKGRGFAINRLIEKTLELFVVRIIV